MKRATVTALVVWLAWTYPLTTIAEELDRSPFANIDPDELLSRTPGFMQRPENLPIGHPEGAIYWDSDAAWGVAMEDFAAKIDGQWLYVVPLVSGGSGGVFGAAVYRWSRGRPRYVETVRTNGYAHFKASDGSLLVDDCDPRGTCAFNRRETHYGFALRTNRLFIKARRLYH